MKSTSGTGKSTTLRALLVALLAVASLSVTAATLQVVAAPSDPGGGAESVAPAGAPGPAIGGNAPAATGDPVAAVVLAVLGVALGVLVARRGGSAVATATGGAVGLALLVGAGTLFWTGGSAGSTDAEAVLEGANGTAGTGAGGTPSLGLLLPVGVLLVGVVVLGGGAVLAANLERTETESGDDAEESVDPEAVGRAAGRAADRIRTGEAATDNEVYRCWAEVTDLVSPANPAACTPSEFATAAIEAGMDADDVETLRRLFEEVRYGDADPGRREREAIEVFERIEAEYASTDAGTDATEPADPLGGSDRA